MSITCTLFVLYPEATVEAAWEELEALGATLLYSETSEEGSRIYGHLDPHLFKDLTQVASALPVTLPDIDWDAQWEAHGHDFHDGCVHLEFPSGKLQLLPGPGFGDLSHPTTKLMIQMMEKHVRARTVIDIGCGSGILSCTAIAMGAQSVHALDIDPNAIQHAKDNAILNQMEEHITFGLSGEAFPLRKHIVALMNMIFSEQVAAWESLSAIHGNVAEIITSGIRVEEREAYLKQCQNWGWVPREELEQEGWCCFWFVHKGPKGPKRLKVGKRFLK